MYFSLFCFNFSLFFHPSSSCLLFSLGSHRFPPLTIWLSVALPVSPCVSFRFPHLNFPGQQADWQHVTTGECAQEVWAHFHTWPCENLKHFYLSLVPPSALPFFFLLLSPLCHFKSVHLSSSIQVFFFSFSPSLSLYISLFSNFHHLFFLLLHDFPPPLLYHSLHSHFPPSSSLLSSPLPPCFSPSFLSSLLLQVMEVCFYRKWQCKELYKGYTGFLYDTAILLITHPYTHTHTYIFSLGTLRHPGTPNERSEGSLFVPVLSLSLALTPSHTHNKSAYKYTNILVPQQICTHKEKVHMYAHHQWEAKWSTLSLLWCRCHIFTKIYTHADPAAVKALLWPVCSFDIVIDGTNRSKQSGNSGK